MHGSSDGEGTNSLVKVFGNIFITFIGAGVLGLPYAFKEAGILEGITVMCIVAVLSIYAMLLIVDCKYRILETRGRVENRAIYRTVNSEESESMLANGNGPHSEVTISPTKRNKQDTVKESLTYGDVGREAIGSKGGLIVDLAIVVSQIGFCCAYLIFIMENVAKTFSHTEDAPEKLKKIILFCIVIPLCLLCFLRHLHKLAIFSLFADFANIFAYSIVFWFDFDHVNRVRMHPKEIDLSGLPFFAGIAIYCYEGAGMVLSLEESMSLEIRDKFRTMFKSTLTVITTLYIMFGVCGYMSFGEETNAIITLNLPDGVFPLLVKGCLCFSLFFTFPVMMFPIIQIIERRFKMENSSWIKGNVLRSGMVLLCMLIVLLIPSFSTLMSLVGATCCNLLAFLLPAIFHMKIFNKTLTRRQKIMDIVLIIIGIFGTVIGTVDSLKRLGIIPPPSAIIQQNPVAVLNDTLDT